MAEVEMKVEKGVAVVTLTAPQRRNALTPGMAAELVAALDDADSHRGVGALVLRGAGGSFCSGAQRHMLTQACADPSSDESFRQVGAVYDAFVRVGHIQAPTIAAVQGAAVGAGLNLALATDLRIVARNTRILSGFGLIGFHPGGGHFALLSRLAGREAAAAIGLFNQEIDGLRAVQLGLAWEARPADDVDARALELAQRISTDPDLTRRVAASFRLQTGPPALPWEAALETERGAQMWSFRRRAENRIG